MTGPERRLVGTGRMARASSRPKHVDLLTGSLMRDSRSNCYSIKRHQRLRRLLPRNRLNATSGSEAIANLQPKNASLHTTRQGSSLVRLELLREVLAKVKSHCKVMRVSFPVPARARTKGLSVATLTATGTAAMLLHLSLMPMPHYREQNHRSQPTLPIAKGQCGLLFQMRQLLLL